MFVKFLTCHSRPYHGKKYLYRYFKESKMQGTISSKMSTSYWELQFTASNMNKNIWKWYLTPSKGKTNVLWSDFLECNFGKYHGKNTYIDLIRTKICEGLLAPIWHSYVEKSNLLTLTWKKKAKHDIKPHKTEKNVCGVFEMLF